MTRVLAVQCTVNQKYMHWEEDRSIGPLINRAVKLGITSKHGRKGTSKFHEFILPSLEARCQ